MAYGVERIKEAIEKIVEFEKALAEALEDKKINVITEGIPLLFKLWGFVPVVKNVKELYAELKDLDEPEKSEVIDWFAEKFDIDNDIAEERIEKAFGAFIVLIDAAFEWLPQEG